MSSPTSRIPLDGHVEVMMLADAAERTAREVGVRIAGEPAEPLQAVRVAKFFPVSAEQWAQVKGYPLPVSKPIPRRTRVRWWVSDRRGRLGLVIGSRIAGYRLDGGDD